MPLHHGPAGARTPTSTSSTARNRAASSRPTSAPASATSGSSTNRSRSRSPRRPSATSAIPFNGTLAGHGPRRRSRPSRRYVPYPQREFHRPAIRLRYLLERPRYRLVASTSMPGSPSATTTRSSPSTAPARRSRTARRPTSCRAASSRTRRTSAATRATPPRWFPSSEMKVEYRFSPTVSAVRELRRRLAWGDVVDRRRSNQQLDRRDPRADPQVLHQQSRRQQRGIQPEPQQLHLAVAPPRHGGEVRPERRAGGEPSGVCRGFLPAKLACTFGTVKARSPDRSRHGPRRWIRPKPAGRTCSPRAAKSTYITWTDARRRSHPRRPQRPPRRSLRRQRDRARLDAHLARPIVPARRHRRSRRSQLLRLLALRRIGRAPRVAARRGSPSSNCTFPFSTRTLNRTGYHWHIHVTGLPTSFRYGWRRRAKPPPRPSNASTAMIVLLDLVRRRRLRTAATRARGKTRARAWSRAAAPTAAASTTASPSTGRTTLRRSSRTRRASFTSSTSAASRSTRRRASQKPGTFAEPHREDSLSGKSWASPRSNCCRCTSSTRTTASSRTRSRARRSGTSGATTASPSPPRSRLLRRNAASDLAASRHEFRRP